ncbi:hypothetical protein, conserved [Eimeria tenella]|uniref:Transmembrane protein n=1 Tax=Eimeria tenella TaxID=5802 RepID=U6KUF1_EIMTE|nr:hypothetical protein, conserved [Eimeria tenella]CDJ41782.1 hypothetical protein, conserved [Eimeria tenella]|eukprot:XP_013232532.1 hypothetical protein, conserved [Eimeria tenella]
MVLNAGLCRLLVVLLSPSMHFLQTIAASASPYTYNQWAKQEQSTTPRWTAPYDTAAPAYSDREKDLGILFENAAGQEPPKSGQHDVSREDQDSASHQKPRMFLKQLKARSVSISLLLLFCFGALALAKNPKLFTRFSEHKKQARESRKSPISRTEEIRGRQARLAEIIPSAESLANAIGTQHARMLVGEVRCNMQLVESGTDDRAKEEAISRALVSLRQLDADSINVVNSLVKEYQRLPRFPVMGLGEQDKDLSLRQLEDELENDEPVCRLVQSLRSFQTKSEQLSRRFSKVSEDFLSGAPFEDELDRYRLGVAAGVLEYLKANYNSQSHIRSLATMLRDATVDGTKVLMIRDHRQSLKSFDGSLGLLTISAAWIEEESKKQADPSDELENTFASIERMRAEAEVLRDEFLTHLEELQRSRSMKVASQAATQAEKAMEQADTTLQRMWETLKGLRTPMLEMSGNSRDQLCDEGKRIHDEIVAESRTIKGLVSDVVERVEKFLKEKRKAPKDSAHVLSRSITTNMLLEGQELESQASRTVDHSAEILRSLQRISDPTHAVTLLVQMKDSLVTLTKSAAAARLLGLQLTFLRMLEKDIKYQENEVESKSAYGFDTDTAAQVEMQRLKRQFDEECESAKSANTLAAVEDHLSAMRQLLSSMDALIADDLNI